MPFNTGIPLFTDYTCLCQVEILRHKSISSSYLIITIYSVLMKKYCIGQHQLSQPRSVGLEH